jgi:integrase
MRRTDTVKHGRSDGIYPYGTAGGVRWRFVYRRSDGTQTTKPASWRSRLRTTRSAPLAICLNNAVKDGLTVANPALLVGRLPAAHIERDYLRLEEIPRYLDACSDLYRPLAETLIGSGLRISEALALRPSDLELELTGGRIIVYRSRRRDQERPIPLGRDRTGSVRGSA